MIRAGCFCGGNHFDGFPLAACVCGRTGAGTLTRVVAWRWWLEAGAHPVGTAARGLRGAAGRGQRVRFDQRTRSLQPHRPDVVECGDASGGAFHIALGRNSKQYTYPRGVEQ